jgi:hypothetical protein
MTETLKPPVPPKHATETPRPPIPPRPAPKRPQPMRRTPIEKPRAPFLPKGYQHARHTLKPVHPK